MQQVNKVTVKPQPKASERSPKSEFLNLQFNNSRINLYTDLLILYISFHAFAVESMLAERPVLPAEKLNLEIGDDLEDPNGKPVKPQEIISMMQEVVVVNVEGVNNFYVCT